MPVMEYEPLYTVKEAAKLLKTNPAFVYGEINRGNLEGLCIGSLKIRGCDLENYINKFPGNHAGRGE